MFTSSLIPNQVLKVVIQVLPPMKNHYPNQNVKEMVISYLSDSNYDIDHIEHKGDIYIFYITDDNGEDIGTITVDSITKELDDTGLSIK